MKRETVYYILAAWTIYFGLTVVYQKPNRNAQIKATEFVPTSPSPAIKEIEGEIIEPIDFPPTIVFEDPLDVGFKKTQLYLLVPKSVETPDGINGIRIGTPITLVGLHRYRTVNGEEFLATDDEITDDPNKVPRVVEQKILSEAVSQDTVIAPNNTQNAPNKPRSTVNAPNNNRLNSKSYNKKDFGRKDDKGNRLPFSK